MAHASSDNLYGLPVFIVDADPAKGSHTTIASALTDASAGDSIGIRPGTYTENLTIPNDVELYAIDGSDLTSNVVISGKLTFTGAITSSFSNIRFTSNGSNIIEATGAGTNQSRFQGCSFFYDTATAIICDNASASLNFQQCQFTQTENSIAMFNVTTCSQFQFIRCNITGAVTEGSSTIAAGELAFYFCKMGGQVFTTSSTGKMGFFQCNYLTDQNVTMLTTAGTGTSNVKDCVIMAGTSSAISVGSGTTVNLFGCNIESSNANPVTGAGTVVYDSIGFSGTGNSINTTTQTARYSQLGKYRSLGQPCFLALASIVTNATGDNTNVTVVFDNEIFDQGGNYNGTNTFTAPVTGKYLFNCFMSGEVTSNAWTGYRISFIASNRTLNSVTVDPGELVTGSRVKMPATCILDMDASDTVTVQYNVQGSTKTLGYRDDSWFSGAQIN